ncbi:hypothetical protein amb0753 [Paramagnetospirillum magneticum AMB-1]|uniref:Uncharacterized protein n=1 Tax=Paramagnetospirillum magneticum (strain ATCC 700264 / AMB-1) TaxID=342108 RepID=Q2W9B8_PARM1|nr:hypothetical protein amb0753 [Paramagnetospirillum magneticum AMB-1]
MPFPVILSNAKDLRPKIRCRLGHAVPDGDPSSRWSSG